MHDPRQASRGEEELIACVKPDGAKFKIGNVSSDQFGGRIAKNPQKHVNPELPVLRMPVEALSLPKHVDAELPKETPVVDHLVPTNVLLDKQGLQFATSASGDVDITEDAVEGINLVIIHCPRHFE
jgi:hypothetical protein